MMSALVSAKWTMWTTCALISRLVKRGDWVCREHGPGGNKSLTYCHFHLKTDDSALSQSPTPSVSQNMPFGRATAPKTTRPLWLNLAKTHVFIPTCSAWITFHSSEVVCCHAVCFISLPLPLKYKRTWITHSVVELVDCRCSTLWVICSDWEKKIHSCFNRHYDNHANPFRQAAAAL